MCVSVCVCACVRVCVHVRTCMRAVMWVGCVCVLSVCCACSEVRGVGVTVAWFKVNSDVTSGNII